VSSQTDIGGQPSMLAADAHVSLFYSTADPFA